MALTPLDRFLLGAYDRAGSRPKLRRLLLHAMRLLHLVRSTLGGWQPGQYKARLALSLALSLAIHAFILSLQFGYAGFGLPGLALPWAERRAHSWDLTVRLVARPIVPAPSPVPAEIAPERRPAAVEPVRPPARTLAASTRPKPVQPPVEARAPVPKREPPKVARAKAKRDREVPVRRVPEIIVQADPQQETFSVPPPAPVDTKPPPEVVARAQPEEDVVAAKERERAARAEAQEEEAAARRAREQEEARRQEEARLQEEARQQQEMKAAREALALEAQRQAEEAARQQALALEAQRKAEEDVRQQTLALERQRALELEAQRQAEEVARQAARQRELEARKQEEARKLEEARRQAEEQAARARAQEAAERAKADALAAQAPSRISGGAIGGSADKPAAGLAGRELAAKALEQLRTPSAMRPEPPRPPVESADPSRRRSVLGSTDRDISVRMYVDSWRWKVERNGNLNFPPAARSRASESPVITVAIRKDGSLEGVYVNRSSGMRSLDEAVRRIVELYAPYSAFPPELARQYDVIEIRRVWFFSNTPNTLRLLEDLPSQ